jgi:hypothetical protein
MTTLHPSSDYTRFNLPSTDPKTPLDANPSRLLGIPDALKRLSKVGDVLVAVDSGAFNGNDKRRYRYTGRNQQGIDAGINHFQGIQRLKCGRDAFLAITAGDSTEVVSHVFFMKMGTRPAQGPWGSNLCWNSEPSRNDGIVRVVALENRKRWHAGGVSVLGDVLAIALEGDGSSAVAFLHIVDPLNPTFLDKAMIERTHPMKAGAVALGRLPDDRFLCVVWREDGARSPVGRLDLYVSKSDSLFAGFAEPRTVRFPDNYRQILGRDPRYQSIALLHSKDSDVFLLGTENTASMAPYENGANAVDLYALDPITDSDTEIIRHVDSCEVHAPREYCNLDAAGGIYVDANESSARLHVYGGYHYRVDETIRFAEFYGRPDGDKPINDIADGWIELWEQSHFGGRRLVIHADRDSTIPDYSRIYVQDGDLDEVGSVRWQLPRGWIYRLYRKPEFRGTQSNIDYLDLKGNGAVNDKMADLKRYKFGRKVSSSRFEQKL